MNTSELQVVGGKDGGEREGKKENAHIYATISCMNTI